VVAVDTNIIVRLLTGDDPAQLERARRLFEAETVFLPKTVILEAEWVLRSLYGLAPKEIAGALSAMVALPQIRCEDVATVIEALECLLQGLDFADALHVASSRMAERFCTFDRALVRRAKIVVNHINVTTL
jgi:predicted nucleic acid-binding protein